MHQSIRFGMALACALGAAAAQGAATQNPVSQGSVTVYGIIDSGVVYTTNANAVGDTVVKVPSLTGTLPSRLGFRGAEDLGHGLQLVFVLENGLGVDNGAAGQGGRLFGRQAYVGLKGRHGTLMLGRQHTMTFFATLKSDILGPNLFGIGSIDPYLPNARSDNTIGYLGTVAGLTLGATYSVGRDTSAAGGPAGTNCAGEVAGNSRACRQASALLGYETRAYGVSASHDVMYGNAGAAAGLTSSTASDARSTLNGYVMLGATRVGGGVLERSTRTATGKVESRLVYLGMSHPLGPALTLDLEAAHRNTRSSPSDVTLLAARLSYALSKRTALYGALGQMENEEGSAVALDAGGTVAAGKTQHGLSLGMRHIF